MREVTKRTPEEKAMNPQKEEPKTGSLAWFREQQKKKPLRDDIRHHRHIIPHHNG